MSNIRVCAFEILSSTSKFAFFKAYMSLHFVYNSIIFHNNPTSRQTLPSTTNHINLIMPYCHRCDRHFKNSRAIHQHIEYSSTHNFCNWCRLDFNTSEGLDNHNDEEHYWCSICEEFFISEPAYDAHLEEEHPYYCDDCEQDFDGQSQLNSVSYTRYD